MSSVRIDALFLLAFFVVLGGVNSAAFQQSGYKHRSSVWSAKMSHLLSLRKNVENENTAGVENSGEDYCLPEAFTTRLYAEVTIEEGNDSPMVVYPVVDAFRDQANKRYAAEVTIGDDTTWYILLCNGSGATGYQFDEGTKQCQKCQQRGCPLIPDPLCLPPSGSFAGSFQLGAGSATLSAQLWTFSSVGRQAVAMGSIAVTAGNAAPVAFAGAFEDLHADTTVSVGAMFTDVTLSAPHPSVFIPPSYCNGETAEEEGEETPEFALFKRFLSFR